MPDSPRRLGDWIEAIAKCERVTITQGRIIARLSGVDYDVTPRVDTDADELLAMLQELQGQMIGVLMTDIPNSSVCVRVIETEMEA